ncbi:MAG: hypothetical protein AAF465_11750 [Pseudomonadota bacterium]
MSKLFKFAVFLGVLYGAYLLFLQPEWVSVGSAEEGFTVEFPHNPKRTSFRQNIPSLGLTTVTNFQYQEGYSGFSATRLTSRAIDQGRVNSRAMEDAAEHMLTKLYGGRIVSSESGTYRGEPYVEIEMRLDDAGSTVQSRLFVNESGLYFFTALSHTVTRTIGGQGRFFRSIRFDENG